ncbi:MAG: tetratricopeptide repeat-containing serine/threonine-protein kinase [Verrucomicrobiales bacterium]|nr:tetratricopeptide repeat-containing serine/threonine-protein kinase [Verrucomicrobiales bacterium]
MKSRGRLSAGEVIELGSALTTALAHLHSQGLVHRDIKPANIVYVGGVPKLADIGLVTDASDACSIVGTAGYIPPEGPGAPQADLYSLGKVLYEAATGRDRRDYPALPDDLRSRPDANLLTELNAVILRGCAANLRKRYQSASQVSADLDLLSAGRSVRRQITRRAMTKLAVSTLLLATVLTVAWWIAARFANRTAARNEFVFETSSTKNREAWTQWREGMFFNEKFTADGLSNAIQCFERAIAIDPNYVSAYLSLADSLTDLPFVTRTLSRVCYPKAEEVLRKAVQLDPANAEALALLGRVKAIYGFGVLEGERLLLRALALDSNNLTVLQNLSMCEAWLGRDKGAIMYARRAQQLDPTSVSVNRNLGHRLFEVRSFNEAIAQFQKTLELHPNHANILSLLAITYEQMGKTNEACETYLKHKAASGASAERMLKFREDFARLGLRAFWSCPSPTGTNSWQPDYPIEGTYDCAHTGDYDSAIRWAELAFDDPLDLVKIKTYPCWDELRKDPRFQELIRRFDRLAGLDDASEAK